MKTRRAGALGSLFSTMHMWHQVTRGEYRQNWMVLDPHIVVQSTHALVYTPYKLAGRADQLPILWRDTYTHPMTVPITWRMQMHHHTESASHSLRLQWMQFPRPNHRYQRDCNPGPKNGKPAPYPLCQSTAAYVMVLTTGLYCSLFSQNCLSSSSASSRLFAALELWNRRLEPCLASDGRTSVISLIWLLTRDVCTHFQKIDLDQRSGSH